MATKTVIKASDGPASFESSSVVSWYGQVAWEPTAPPSYLTQLMGLAFGLQPKELGLDKHFVDPIPLLRGKGIVPSS